MDNSLWTCVANEGEKKELDSQIYMLSEKEMEVEHGTGILMICLKNLNTVSFDISDTNIFYKIKYIFFYSKFWLIVLCKLDSTCRCSEMCHEC